MSKKMKSTKHIIVQGSKISLLLRPDNNDYISLTDMAKKFGDDVLIYHWMRNRNTVEFLGIWERMHNPDFKGIEFETFKILVRYFLLSLLQKNINFDLSI